MELNEILEKLEECPKDTPVFLNRTLRNRERNMMFFYNAHLHIHNHTTFESDKYLLDVHVEDQIKFEASTHLLLDMDERGMPRPKIKVYELSFRIIPSAAENVYVGDEIPQALKHHGLGTYVPFLNVIYEESKLHPQTRAAHEWDNLKRRQFPRLQAYHDILQGTFKP